MSGHNKWSKIKHKKAATDAKKSKEFGKLAQLIAIESKKAEGDNNSPSLRVAIEKAKRANMPSSNIDRAVARGAGGESINLEEVIYETYGPGGVAIIATGFTDNKNRTAAEIKHLLSKQGYTLAQPGSASWSFEKTTEGYIPKSTVEISQEDRERLAVLTALLEEHDDIHEVTTNAS